MKIAIHHRSGSFSDRWIAYCEKKSIPYKLVNAFDSDIVEQLSDCDAFMWHHHHAVYKDVIAAKKILFALELAGIKVFPDFKTGWHFDDKVAQKYLFEALNVPFVKSYVFYDRKEALSWARNTEFPKVFKLKGGAGSANVRLVKSKSEAKKLINKAFNRGFSQFDRFGYARDRYKRFIAGRDSLLGVIKGLARIILPTKFASEQPRERGYVYLQEFIPNNDSDTRVIVIGERAFAIKRMTREGDFRASGSGNVFFEREDIDLSCIALAFEINSKLQSQCAAFDFIFDNKGKPLLVEASFAFVVKPYDACPGYWDIDLNWYEGSFNPQHWMIEDLIGRLSNEK